MTDQYVTIRRELLERELLSVLDFSESNLRRVVDHLIDVGYTLAAAPQPPVQDSCVRCGKETVCGKTHCEACCYEPISAPQPSDAYRMAVDTGLVCAHIGVTNPDDDYETARKKLNDLICWSVQVDRDLGQPSDDVAKVAWIPVSERLPEHGQEVIVNSDFDGVCAGVLDSYDEWFAPCSEYKITRITHWMPLPAAPGAAPAYKEAQEGK